MRQHSRSPGIRRAAVLAMGTALTLSLAIPAVAGAAPVPVSTIRVSPRYLLRAKTFTVAGRIGPSLRGKTITVEIRKPGRTYWSRIATPRIGSTGAWSWRYYPKLGGKFYFRARYLTGRSRTVSLTVKRGPGVRYEILLASTTSTRDSGLFERLGPAFLAACPEYSLKAVFVGSGAAIALGGSGDADVLLTHSPAAEVDFMRGIVAGVRSARRGKTRYKVMYNDFLLAGPNGNPAGVVSSATSGSARAAFQAVATAGSTFWSRNDNSGTNAKEKEIWKSLGNPQSGKAWYKASGTMGMAQALAACDAGTGGYTLADRATWLTVKNLGTIPHLKIVNEGDPTYFNQYSVIEVRGARNWDGAMDFSDWIRSRQAQELIRTFGEYTYGQKLFTPNAGPY